MGESFKQFSVQSFGRPEGYQYPVGLTPFTETTGITTTNVASSTTGGDQAVDTVNNLRLTHTPHLALLIQAFQELYNILLLVVEVLVVRVVVVAVQEDFVRVS